MAWNGKLHNYGSHTKHVEETKNSDAFILDIYLFQIGVIFAQIFFVLHLKNLCSEIVGTINDVLYTPLTKQLELMYIFHIAILGFAVYIYIYIYIPIDWRITKHILQIYHYTRTWRLRWLLMKLSLCKIDDTRYAFKLPIGKGIPTFKLSAKTLPLGFCKTIIKGMTMCIDNEGGDGNNNFLRTLFFIF